MKLKALNSVLNHFLFFYFPAEIQREKLKNVFLICERKNPWLIHHRSWEKNFYHKKKNLHY